MLKQNEVKSLQLQENDNLTSTGWFVWLLCLAISLGGSMAFFAWAKGDLNLKLPSVESLSAGDN
ncbi:MAG: hypothetical protein F6K11_33900 [Leptolyngbya sp. SIO3F4]|nr:hypothetical protein [Leptolyngbya sp. SIO3F4]